MKIKIFLVLSLGAMMCFAGCKSGTNANMATTNMANSNMATANSNMMAKTPESPKTDMAMESKIQDALKAKGYEKVTVDTATSPATLRGTYPKGKLAEVIQVAMEANGGKPVKNEATEEK